MKTRTAILGWVVAAALTVGYGLGSLRGFPSAHAQVDVEDSSEPRPLRAGAAADAQRLSDGFADVAERVSGSVVQIDVNAVGRHGRHLHRRKGMGSGFLFDREGHILTNHHVVAGASSVKVTMQDGRTLSARVVGSDPALDVAVLVVEGRRLLPLPLGRSEDARVGEWVIAVGSPFGLDHTVTAGVLSAKGRHGIGMGSLGDFLQTDAAINPGNSGGPLVNLRGEVIGMNSMIFGRGAGLGFAIPIEMVQDSAQQLLAAGRVERAWLGSGLDDLQPDLARAQGAPEGARAFLASIEEGGPAALAGLQAGDVVVSIEGDSVRDSRQLVRRILQHRPGARVTLVVVREGRTTEIAVVLGSRPTND